MTKDTRKSRSTSKPSARRAFTRRVMLKRSLLAGAIAVGPWYVKDALSSSGELNLLIG